MRPFCPVDLLNDGCWDNRDLVGRLTVHYAVYLARPGDYVSAISQPKQRPVSVAEKESGADWLIERTGARLGSLLFSFDIISPSWITEITLVGGAPILANTTEGIENTTRKASRQAAPR